MRRILTTLCIILLGIGAAAPLTAAVSETDALIQLLVDKGLLSAEEAAALRADLAVQKQEEKDKQKAFQVTTGRPLQLSGYAQVRYRDDDAINDTFDTRRARLSLKGDLGRGFDYRLQADFAGSSAKLLDAALGWRYADGLKVTAGQFKIPFSQENLISSSALETINRSQVVEALVARGKDVNGNQNGRDIGVMAGGSFTLFKTPGGLEYAAGVFNGSGINTSDTNEEKDFAGRVRIKPFKGFSIGGSYSTGRTTLSAAPDEESLRRRAGAEIAYTRGPFLFKGEFIRGDDARIEKDGWYALAAWTIVPQRFQAVLKYDAYDPDRAVTDKETSIATAGFNWFFSQWAFLQVNYEVKDETGTEVSNNALTGQLTLQF